MAILLYGVGGIIIVAHFIMGIQTGSLTAFLAVNATGFAKALIFFALGKILINQEDIRADLRIVENNQRPVNVSHALNTCNHCHKKYDSALVSCPYCGYRE
ncbi:hypothetical protein HZI73_09465 [Vallitalea pronyensis]|uniref:Uncharacterized protein n=1 Tax=Vallitalea pronyensis TaxID=1348613 RepID=A0A8J8SGL5_9FIRM|nr:hypothetical protein [Vallitalea pronyensis]QUI22514.1 hypothetical protein HZI73_09465 [Vallitalea pronyensis]